MASDIKVGISLNLKGVRDVASATRELERQIRDTEGRFKKLSESGKLSQRQLGEAATAMRAKVAAARAEIGKLNDTVGKTAIGKYAANIEARRTLGIRAEVDIQRDIKKTEAAYQKLVSSGVLSTQQQGRAYEAMRQKVTQLTNEMGRLTVAQKTAAGFKFAATAAVGVAAAAYTLKAPAERAMSYDRQLANMANTAFAERDAAGRKIGMKQLEEAVNKARKQGGGTREDAAQALDTMIASGVVSNADAIKMLPGIMKAATAANTNANDLATIAIRAQQTFKISADDLPQVLSSALAAGQAGGFELKDMGKWLPQQMAMAGNLGLSGKEGFARLAAWNQASVITAGSKDEAGNNLRDLLNELNTPHFKKFLGDQLLGDGTPGKKGERNRRMKDIDAVYLDYQAKGIDKVSATLELMQQVFAKDKRYQELQAKLKAADPKDKEGKRVILEAMSAQVEGSNIGKIFHNQQSLMAMLGLMNNAQYVDDVLGKVKAEYTAPEDKSATSIAHEVIASTADYKVEQAKEDAAVAQKAAMDNLTPAIGKAADAFSNLASKHPMLVGTISLAIPAVGAFTGAVGLATLAMNAMGGKGGVSAIGKLGSMTGSAGATKLGQAGLLTGALMEGYNIGETVINPLVDSGVQKLTGDKDQTLGGWIYDLLHKDPMAQNLKPVEQKPVDVNARMTLALAPGLVLQGQSVQSSGGNVEMNTGSVWTGAPR